MENTNIFVHLEDITAIYIIHINVALQYFHTSKHFDDNLIQWVVL